MGAVFEEDLSPDSLDLIERIMSLEEEFSLEMPEDDFRRWLQGDDDWLNGAPVPRRGLPPSLPGAIELEPPAEDLKDGGKAAE